MRYQHVETGEEAFLVYAGEDKWVFIGEQGRFFVQPNEVSKWAKV